MTRSELRVLISGWLDDENNGYFSTTQINTWLNLAQRKVQMVLLQAGENYYMKPVQTNLVIGQSDYILPSDFFVEHRCEIVLSGTGYQENRQQLLPITTNQQDRISIQLGDPTHYYMKKDRVTLSPTPQSALTFRLYYSPLVQDMSSDSDEPDVPEQYHEYVAMIAAYNGFIKDDRAPDNLANLKKEWDTLVKQMSEDRNQDLSRRIVELDDYYSVGMF